MKKIMAIALALLLIIVLVGCAQGNSQQTSTPAPNPDTDTGTETDEETEPESESYTFEFEDINGDIHRLSDYAGKPVYLKIWASWCGPCVYSLGDLDLLSAQAEDYTVLSVVMPGFQGEMSREDFTEWFRELGYENIVVLFDDDAQIKNDFGVRAYPSQILFDAKGQFAYGVPGLMSAEKINAVMIRIAEGVYG